MKKIYLSAMLAIVSANGIAAADEVSKASAPLKKEIAVTIKPGKVHEECVALKSGTTVAYRFKASKPVPFNIHFHSGTGKDEKVEYPVKLNETDVADDVLKVAADQQYCWMWSNKKVTTESVTITGMLESR